MPPSGKEGMDQSQFRANSACCNNPRVCSYSERMKYAAYIELPGSVIPQLSDQSGLKPTRHRLTAWTKQSTVKLI